MGVEAEIRCRGGGGRWGSEVLIERRCAAGMWKRGGEKELQEGVELRVYKLCVCVNAGD